MSFTSIIALGFIFILSLPVMIMAIYLSPLILLTVIILASLSMGMFYIFAKLAIIHSRWSLIRKCKQLKAVKLKALQGNFNSLQLQNINAKTSMLQHTTFNRANLSNMNLSNSAFQHSCFRNAILSKSNCSKTNFAHCDFSFANITKANLSYVNLTNSNLTKSNFTRTKLIRSNISKVIAKNAWFKHTNLTGSNLKNSSFHGANFCGADLTGCLVDKTIFQNAYFDHTTKLPFGFETAISKGMFYIPRSLKHQSVSKNKNKNKFNHKVKQQVLKLDPISRHDKMTCRYGEL